MRESNDVMTILKDLIRLRSDVDEREGRDESSIASYIESFLRRSNGWSITKQEIGNGRYNIVATTSPTPRLVFMGHMDTVPVTDTQSLEPVLKGTKLYGRGAVDMKPGIALMLWLSSLEAWSDTALVFTCGEEYDFCGIQAFMKQYGNWKPQLVINLEPTDLCAYTSCRGVCEVSLTLGGKAAHAGNKSIGVNAIEKAVEFCSALERAVQELDTYPLVSSLNLAKIEGGSMQNGQLICRPNVVPDTAVITIEIRLGSDMKKQDLERLCTETARELGIQIQNYTQGLWYAPMNSGTVNEAQKMFTDQNGMFTVGDPNISGFYEVAIAVCRWSCPVVMYGPGPAAQAHQAREYVDCRQLQTAQERVLAFVTRNAYT